ncbi:hypothetical protein [Enterococcus pallens]|uniref:Uncharacterized protein n=1 Tax=Enterococcus pallens ATCC BAA-351 TaxID=1158607 RepID=R2T3M1_9ENTE|nr:hypothetical protein [Enterococcus pallens]EOH94834.1 hypothetical protein UAU_01756 [Enterococcus pallens ATCC BAA-351]EOU14847.1 hypothetical protein I588_04497 [Enterococcus pallens ATCC BAA-351]OJG76223.1 hypothetical protein RV10_GL004130 [Enterococcus pallens]
MDLKKYALMVLKGNDVKDVDYFGFQYLRTTPNRVALVVWDDLKKEKASIPIVSKEKRTQEKPWENIHPNYTWVPILDIK